MSGFDADAYWLARERNDEWWAEPADSEDNA